MRYLAIDSIRGLSVIGMICYHAYYLFIHVFWGKTSQLFDVYMRWFQPIIGITFIFLAGFSFFLSSRNKTLWILLRGTFIRAGILWILALTITYVTYTFFYEQRIGFGIIHFFAIASLLSLWFIRTGKWNIFFGIGILLLGTYFSELDGKNLWLMPFWIAPKVYFSADYYPVFPWFWYFLIGHSCAYWMNQFNTLSCLLWKKNLILSPLIFIGQHALLFYLLHVPILYIFFSLFF